MTSSALLRTGIEISPEFRECLHYEDYVSRLKDRTWLARATAALIWFEADCFLKTTLIDLVSAVVTQCPQRVGEYLQAKISLSELLAIDC
jgi:hypothetical protein